MGAYLTWGALGGMGAIIPPVVISVGVLLCYSFCVYQTNIVVWFKIRMGRKRGHLRIISCVSPLEYENGVQCNLLVRRCWLSHWGRGQLYHYSLGFSFSLKIDNVHHSAVGSSAAIGAVNISGYPDLTQTQEASSSVYPQLTPLLPVPLTSRGWFRGARFMTGSLFLLSGLLLNWSVPLSVYWVVGFIGL